MILADKIIELRKKNGWSQEELAQRMDVSRQSISKWESAQSVPDMNRILRLSEVFGVSTDLLLKDELELTVSEQMPVPALREGDELEICPVSMEQAVDFLDYRNRSARSVALGVMMCILAPVLLIILAAGQETGVLALTESQVVSLGVIPLMLLVGGAVALFVLTGLRGKPWELWTKQRLDTSYGVDGMVKERRERFRPAYTAQLVTGIVLCVVAVIPVLLAVSLYGEQNEFACSVGVAVMLGLIALGVLLIVRSSIIWGGFSVLLEEGDYTRQNKAESKRNELLSSAYWCGAVAIYLGWSFVSGAWDRTWIVWPIAGVGFGLVLAVARILRTRG